MLPTTSRPLRKQRSQPLAVCVALLGLIAQISMHSLGSNAQETELLSPLVMNLDAIKWGPAGGGNGFPEGVRTARQGINPATGGITYFALFPAGSHFKLHRHTHDEFVVVASGALNIQLGEQHHALEVGSYIVIPGSLQHSWTVPAEGKDAVILVRRAGPADFEFID